MEKVKRENPKISFDTSLLDIFPDPNIWFLEILTNETLKTHLKQQKDVYAGILDLYK